MARQLLIPFQGIIMTKLTFYPLNNADCCLVSLDGKTLLYDYADTAGEDACDLPTWLKEDLGGADAIDVVAFSHSDQDHVQGAKDFFYLEHARKYQGEGRIKIKELWVPADMITERHPKEDESARVLREEARHRLKQGNGIKVFSRPGRLEDWLSENNLTLESRIHCIVNAGEIIDGLSLEADGIEVFAHAPFSMMAGEEIIDKNTNSLVHQLTVRADGRDFKVLMSADAVQETLDGVVIQTKRHHNEERLEWDILKIPHHCSYLSLNAEEKGVQATEPSENVEWFLDQGQKSSRMVMTCKKIPSEDTDQPPHKQAYATYLDRARRRDASIVVTMDNPKKRTVIEFGGSGHTLVRNAAGPAAIITSRRTERFG